MANTSDIKLQREDPWTLFDKKKSLGTGAFGDVWLVRKPLGLAEWCH